MFSLGNGGRHSNGLTTQRKGTALLGRILANVERADPFPTIGKLQYFGIRKRMPGILVAGHPMILHRAPREFKILGNPFVLLGAIDQVHDIANLVVRDLFEKFYVFAVAKFRGKPAYEI